MADLLCSRTNRISSSFATKHFQRKSLNFRPSSAAEKVGIVCGTNNLVKSEMLGDRHTDTHTDTQTKYCNPRCACAPRVNNRVTGLEMGKNLRANAGKTPMTSRQILVSGVSVRRRGPLTGIWWFISRAGHPLKGSCAFTNIRRYLQHSGRKLYHAQL